MDHSANGEINSSDLQKERNEHKSGKGATKQNRSERKVTIYCYDQILDFLSVFHLNSSPRKMRCTLFNESRFSEEFEATVHNLRGTQLNSQQHLQRMTHD